MNAKRMLALLAIAAAACGQTMTAEQKIRMLEGMRMEIMADLHRQQAECRAQAIEFADSPMRDRVVSSCFESYRFMVDVSQKSLDNLDRRIAEIGAEAKRPGLIPFSGKLDGER